MPTLSELKQKKSGFVEDPNSLKTISRDQFNKIAPTKPEENGADKIVNDELNAIDELLNTEMKQVEETQKGLYDETENLVQDAIFDVDVDAIDMGMMTEEETKEAISTAFQEATQSIKEDPNIKAGIDAVSNVTSDTDKDDSSIDDLLQELDIDDDEEDDDSSDISEEDDDDENEEDEEEQKRMLKDMQDQVSEVIKPFNNIIDLKSFTISTKPKNAQKVLEETDPNPTATWVLLDSKTPFTCSALGAVEIENLNPERLNGPTSGKINALKQMYGTLYSHYTSPNKPKTLEEWVKTISFSDQDNLIFGYYKATFKDSNLITYACSKCNEVKVKNVPIDDCIKYKDEATKNEVEEILKYGDPTHKGVITSKLVQVSDRLAVSIKNPSIYNIVFEFGLLDSAFTSKFSDVLGLIGYIEDIYEIDYNTHQLIPIRVKEDPKNITKSIKRRIRGKVQILKTLTPDQYNILTTKIAEISKNAERISYCQPEYKCEKCGNTISENVMTAQQLLFMRHQLALIKTLSVE